MMNNNKTARQSHIFDVGEKRSKKYVRSVIKAAQILRQFTIENSEIGATELSKRLGMQKTVTYNIAETLVSEGLLEKDPLSHRYRVGLRSYEAGQLYANRSNLQEIAYITLTHLRDETDYSTYLGFLDQGDAFILCAVESTMRIRIAAMAGERRPPHTTAIGKAMLAGLTRRELRQMLPKSLRAVTPQTITNWRTFEDDLELVRQRGYSLVNGEMVEGASSVGAPVIDTEGVIVGAVSVGFPTSPKPGRKIPLIIRAVQHAARDLSSSVGSTLRSMGDIAILRPTSSIVRAASGGNVTYS